MISAAHLSHSLAAAVVAGEWSVEGSILALHGVLQDVTGAKRTERLALEIHRSFSGPYCPAPNDLAGLVLRSAGFFPRTTQPLTTTT